MFVILFYLVLHVVLGRVGFGSSRRFGSSRGFRPLYIWRDCRICMEARVRDSCGTYAKYRREERCGVWNVVSWTLGPYIDDVNLGILVKEVSSQRQQIVGRLSRNCMSGFSLYHVMYVYTDVGLDLGSLSPPTDYLLPCMWL